MSIRKWAVFTAVTAAAMFFPMTAMADSEMVPTDIAASSTLSGGDYDAWNLIDNNQTTAWVEGASGDGIGEFVDYFYPSGTVITGGTIYPAYYKNQDIFEKNSGVTSIRIQSGSQSVVIDCQNAASSMVNGGYTFTIDGGIVCDGTLRTSIESIRSGWKYTDTCISELHFYGTAAGSSTSSSTSTVSSNGGDSISRETAEGLSALASNLLKKHLNYGLSSASISVSDLTSADKAFIFYWYQYHYTDSRVSSGSLYNQAEYAGIQTIGTEIFGNFSDADTNEAINNYSSGTNGNLYSFSCTGDFGDAGPYYFTVEGVRRNASGNIEVYGPIKIQSSSLGDGVTSFAAEYAYTGAEAVKGWQFVRLTVS